MTDRIEKTTLIRAPIERVWRAITDHREFGSWFLVALHGPFLPGEKVTGSMTYPGYEGFPFVAWVKEVSAPHRFVFDWVPGDTVPDDLDAAPRTTVEFLLHPVAEGTRLQIIESGFDRIPENQRAGAIRSNTEGWGIQSDNLRRYAEA